MTQTHGNTHTHTNTHKQTSASRLVKTRFLLLLFHRVWLKFDFLDKLFDNSYLVWTMWKHLKCVNLFTIYLVNNLGIEPPILWLMSGIYNLKPHGWQVTLSFWSHSPLSQIPAVMAFTPFLSILESFLWIIRSGFFSDFVRQQSLDIFNCMLDILMFLVTQGLLFRKQMFCWYVAAHKRSSTYLMIIFVKYKTHRNKAELR